MYPYSLSKLIFDASSDKRCIRLSVLFRDRAPPSDIKSSLQGDARFISDTECWSPLFLLPCLSHPPDAEPVFDVKVVEMVEDAVESFR